MRTSSILVRVGGVAMLGAFCINLYIGLYDTNLAQLSPLHWQLNWVIAAIDAVAAIALFVRPGSTIWRSLAGVAWPVVYVVNLLVDIETRLCLGTPASSCSPTVSDAYQYLILGSSGEDWVLWPYTIRLAIGLVIVTLILATTSFLLRKRT